MGLDYKMTQVNALSETDLSSTLMSEYPDYLFITADEDEATFNALRLIVGGGFPNTNWITVAYYMENYSETNGEEANYESLTFGCVYRENVVKGPAIYHVGTYYIDSSCLIDLEKDFGYHDDDAMHYNILQYTERTVTRCTIIVGTDWTTLPNRLQPGLKLPS